MSAQTIYIKLVAAGMSPVGACAMMGNMQAESAMRSNNAQDGFSQFSDEVYTSYADRGLLDFVNDSIGYGLCQWTYAPRKRNLLAFARSLGVSIGNEDMQVDFCIKELQTEYASLWRYLTTATGVYEAAGRICREYERPAVNNVDGRAAYANQFYMSLGSMEMPELGTTPAEDDGPGNPAPTVEVESYWPPRVLAYGMAGPDVVALQGLMIAHGFPAGITGQFDQATYDQIGAFQSAKGLIADGVAGRQTWAALVKGV